MMPLRSPRRSTSEGDTSTSRRGRRRPQRRRSRRCRGALLFRGRTGAFVGCTHADCQSAAKSKRTQSWPALGSSVWLAREDECCAGNDRCAGPDEGHVDILDLTRTGATGGLEGALDDVPQAVNAARAQAATKRVQRQLAVKRDPTALNKVEGLAMLAEAVGTQGRTSRTPRSRRRFGRRRRPSAKSRSVPT